MKETGYEIISEEDCKDLYYKYAKDGSFYAAQKHVNEW